MLKVALAQMNLVVGDISGNVRRIQAAMQRAEDGGAQVLVMPELAITGYPAEDLLLRRSFLEANLAALVTIAAAAGEVVSVVGFVEPEGERIFNSAAVCSSGRVIGVYRKHLLPNYGVFDERRYFTPGSDHLLLEAGDTTLGVSICEDAWSAQGPVVQQGRAGAQVLLNINASPFHKGKREEREEVLAERARLAGAPIVYVNLVGGQDELIFDGGSLVIDGSGEVHARLSQFEEAFAVVDVPVAPERTEVFGGAERIHREPVALRSTTTATKAPRPQILEGPAEIYGALCLSIRDYARKNGFERALVGLSGGIDSALTATLAVDSLGPENVLGVTMPSQFSSTHSVNDAHGLAEALGMQVLTIPIRELYERYLEALESSFGPAPMGVAEENLQARLRGTLLMTISNRYGHLVLATGNKSELACGYATLYGDMAGGFAPLKDVFKTEVYELAHYRNSVSPVIPASSITKPPSAELRPGQQDSDSLPPYELLDRILAAYIERDEGVAEIVAGGADPEVVRAVTRLVDGSEYKRRQGAPGPKVTTKAFGRDRRLPITNRWQEEVE